MTAPGLFITGTGTELGKTFITALLTRQLRAAGRTVAALKPIVSGFSMDADDSDTRLLAEAQDLPWSAKTAARLSPLRFAEPLSPDMAARREGRALSLEAVIEATYEAWPESGICLVEGVGGALVPVSDRETVADWIAALAIPSIVVAGSYLGTLSHTLTTVEAMTARGVPPSAIVVSQSADQPVPLDETVTTLSRHTALPIWSVPRQTGQEVPADLAGLADFAGPPQAEHSPNCS